MATNWTSSQLEAINHSGSDLIISAAAGSGKTATLTERIIRKIKDGADISKMLIVTFTKAAAGELKNKISKLLSESLKLDPKNAHLSNQLIRVSYADICTIDSFCMKIVKPNFDKLLLSGDFRIGESGEISILESEAMEELIDELYESESKNEDFLLVADCYSSIWSESELASAILKLRNKLISTANGIKTLLQYENNEKEFFLTPYGEVLLTYIKEGTDYFISLYDEALNVLSESEKGKKYYVPLFESELEYLKRVNKAILAGASYEELRNIVTSYDFPRISSASLENEDINLKLYKDIRKSCADFFKKKLIGDYFLSEPGAIGSSTKQNARICRAIYNILVQFEERLKRKKSFFSVYSFDDISSFACELLIDENGEPTQLARDIADKYDEIYIDEYQDTNSVQDKIFKAISKNNRFMVGDIKQSIYRFRSAEPEIFSYYRTNFSTKENFDKNSLGKSIFMSDNFRCDKNVIDFSNLVSDYMFENSSGIPYVSDDRLRFSKIIEGPHVDKKTEVHIIDSSVIDDPTEFQAEYVARRIKHMIDNETLPNGDRIKPSDIAILFRYGSHIQQYIDALERYGVYSRYQSAEPFLDKPHIMLMLCILNTIDNPSKDIYLAGAMRSEVFNFSLDELIEIKKKMGGSGSLYSTLKSYDENDSLYAKIVAFLEKLKEYRQATRKMTSYEAISYIYGRCGILSMCSPQEKADLLKLYNIAREFEGNSFKGLYSFLKYVEKLAGGTDEKEFKGDITRDNVQLMTIHASKGLEYKICFVCDTESNFIYKDLGEPLLFQRELGVSGFVGKEGGLVKFEPLVRKCIALKKARDMHEEEMRILYVAMTRAKHKLIITGYMSHPNDHIEFARNIKNHVCPYTLYSSSSLLKFIIGAIATDNDCFEYVPVTAMDSDAISSEALCPVEIPREEIEACKSILKERFEFEYKYDYLKKLPSKISISKLYPEILDNTENDDIEVEPLDSMPEFMLDAEKKVSPAQRGTAAHVFMQFCSFESLITNGVEYELERLVNESYISKADAEIIKSYHLDRYLEKFAKSQLLADILSAKQIIREFRFNVMLDADEFTEDSDLAKEKVLVQGVTDCIYETEDGALVLVDYKTDYVTLDNYEKELLASHKDQLTYYKKACEMMFERPISKVLIYSVPLAKTVEVK